MSRNQTINGKSFEYALLVQFEEKLRDKTSVKIIKSTSFQVAQNCFNQITELQKSEFLLYASFAVNFLVDLEPRLANGIEENDILELEILPDKAGESGDVRDVLAIRVLQKWEIGVSAKNNHNAVKHSRLSSDIDFGKWLNIKVIKDYQILQIKFQSKNYPIRQIELPEFDTVNISINSLNNKLLDEYGSYFSPEANTVDEQIFFFVEDDEIYLPNEQLKNLVINQVL